MRAIKLHHKPTTILDDLVCELILGFLHHLEWPTVKPFLISKSFNNTFGSETFTNSYLNCILRLDNLDGLNSAIELFESYIVRDGEEEEEPQVKKRKIDWEMFRSIPSTTRHVLEMFVCCDIRWWIDIQKTFHSFDINNSDTKEITNKLEIVNSQKLISDKLHKYISKVSENGLRFAQIKRVFIIKSTTSNKQNEGHQNLVIVIFTECGFPLLIETSFSFDSDNYHSSITESELISVYSSDLFSTCISSCRGDVDKEITSYGSLLKKVGKLLLKTSTEENIGKKHFELVYGYCQCLFGMYSSSFLCQYYDRFEDEYMDYSDEESEEVLVEE